jgi:uncharacterized protein (DUF2345 family)
MTLFREFLHALAGLLPGLSAEARDELAAAIDQHVDEHQAATQAATAAVSPETGPAPEGTQP